MSLYLIHLRTIVWTNCEGPLCSLCARSLQKLTRNTKGVQQAGRFGEFEKERKDQPKSRSKREILSPVHHTRSLKKDTQVRRHQKYTHNTERIGSKTENSYSSVGCQAFQLCFFMPVKKIEAEKYFKCDLCLILIPRWFVPKKRNGLFSARWLSQYRRWRGGKGRLLSVRPGSSRDSSAGWMEPV